MKKTGFTLAEVLISLAIVGVVSAIAIPTFVSNTQAQSNVAKLSTVASALENALTTMIASEAAIDLTDTTFGKNYSEKISTALDELSKFLKFSESEGHGDTAYGGITAAEWTLTKSGAYLGFETTAGSNDNATVNSIGRILIDVNGGTKPNKEGKDIFAYAIGEDGILYPAGSSNYKTLYEDAACEGDVGIGCTATIVENGYKLK